MDSDVIHAVFPRAAAAVTVRSPGRRILGRPVIARCYTPVTYPPVTTRCRGQSDESGPASANGVTVEHDVDDLLRRLCTYGEQRRGHQVGAG
jgi:hypothetical protein